MDALLMCGGKGTRLESTHEKPLYPIAGRPMADRVHDALEESQVEQIYAAVSVHTPATKAHFEDADGICVIETPGEGYVTDLQKILERAVISRPLLSVPADLPLLDATIIDEILDAHDGTASMTVCVPESTKRRLGVSVDSRLEGEDNLVPTGVNIVGDPDVTMTYETDDTGIAINVNRREDALIASNQCD